MDDFEWDESKANRNREIHGVSFGEAASAFADPLGLHRPDETHSVDEERCLLLGHSYRQRLLVVVYSSGESASVSSAPGPPRAESEGTS